MSFSLEPFYYSRAKHLEQRAEFTQAEVPCTFIQIYYAVRRTYLLSVQYQAIWNRETSLWSSWAAGLPTPIKNDSLDYYATFGNQSFDVNVNNFVLPGTRWANLIEQDLSLFVHDGGPTLSELEHYQQLQWMRILHQHWVLGVYLELCDAYQARTGAWGGKLERG